MIAGSVCAACYAFERGNYRYSSVQKAQSKRLEGIEHPLWVEAMVLLLTRVHARGTGKGRKLSKHHRWHDSGDLQSRDHLARICAVARATPWLKHWLPTREAMMVVGFVRDGGVVPGNLVIRVSATMIDGSAPRCWPLTSTVHSASAPSGHLCPAPLQGNSCGLCRACWDASVGNVSYHVH